MPTKGLDSPIILCGAERSGTTLLRLMLDHHPEIAFQHEFELSVEKLPRDGGWPRMADFYDYLRTYRFASFTYEIDKALDYPGLIKSMLEQKRTRDRKRLLGATVHLHFDRVLRIWPQATYIKLVRDGRDVARSIVGMGWEGHVYYGVERWITAEKLWDKVKTLVPEERRIEVRYESLVADPVGELTRVCKWIGVDFSPKMLEYMHTERGRTYKYPDPKLSYQWRKKLERREIELLESRVADLLVERGYELSGYPRIDPDPVEIAALWAQNRTLMVRHRIGRLGFGLWLESVVSSRVGPKSWADEVQLKINEVIDAHLD